MKVAVIEDEADIARMYQAILDDAGHQVVFVDQHNLEAVDGCDAVIVDLMMPDVGGSQVLDWLTQWKPNVRKVVATAMYQVPAEVRSAADVVLTKPFTGDALLQAIR